MSLTAIPPTAGFAAKFVVILSAVRAGYIALAVLAVACTGFFMLRDQVDLFSGTTRDIQRNCMRRLIAD